MPLRSKKQGLTREDTLRARPIKNEAVRESRQDNGEIILVVPRKKVWWLRILSRIFYIRGQREISLDEIGSWVWHKCDGRVSVGKIMEDLAKEFKINRKEAEVSLLSYLKKLGEKRLIGFLMDE